MTNDDKKTLRGKLLASARWLVKWTRKANPRAKLPRYVALSRLWSGRTWVSPNAGSTLKIVTFQKLTEPVPEYQTVSPPIMAVVYDTERDRICDEWVTRYWSEMEDVPGWGTWATNDLLLRIRKFAGGNVRTDD